MEAVSCPAHCRIHRVSRILPGTSVPASPLGTPGYRLAHDAQVSDISHASDDRRQSRLSRQWSARAGSARCVRGPLAQRSRAAPVRPLGVPGTACMKKISKTAQKGHKCGQ
ncbi:hypothetical protein GDO78_011062 [Eleutherodactylus coqui]|uniref:Uncharacterized protein n=1 Tax=Eleutherodactylus coqui TaxID=57060 RepID=A0A8J6K850_ELECQ|nr:hypothetical protein GDO78_011062 [Eleutherodactylus coqui]